MLAPAVQGVAKGPLAADGVSRETRGVSPVAPAFRIVLLDEAVVAERGEQVVVWFVRLGSAWVRAAEHPRAETSEARADRQDESCPPGTIWRRTVTLELEVGTHLRRTLSRPHSKRMSPMEHLLSGSLEKRREVRETHFRVERGGRLERRPRA